ncbi:uncharacterized protein Z519_00614 [Cladophialophora bantiana CBS 173.52]|uniref:DUF7587 domain-containing protein n=1 Tax=Cladophialophora bantiana (strain ATCC 10958 / CBS 173.52 / CDC B-1940 / NIH 8579) TaxID=1442370 RepID=A0A0D2FA54_CLAB1|nr:uncharacterized protein Z519_00614 [Cladophialophora bantiana CBS 173.52]KIW98951.1 hypothetical protein Z519_00614 [Cladophialophora bantiana CBS 173.52]
MTKRSRRLALRRTTKARSSYQDCDIDSSVIGKRRRTDHLQLRKRQGAKMKTGPDVMVRESTETTIASSTESSFYDSCSTGLWDTDANSDGHEDYPHLDDNDFPNTADRLNPLLKLRFNNKRKWSYKRPRLLFRAFEPQHGLCARRFQDSATSIPRPPTYGGDKFRKLVYRHLITDKFPSPFLSWTENPERALEKHLAKSSERRSLAIVDYNVLEDDFEKFHGIGTGPWLVPKICETYVFNDLQKINKRWPPRRGVKRRKGYKGTGEFLIWGSVPGDPVAVLAYEEAVRLMDEMKSLSSINYASGVAFSRFLNNVPPKYKAVVARKLLHAYQIPGYEKDRHFESFVRGIYGDPPNFSDLDAHLDEINLGHVLNGSSSANPIQSLRSMRDAKKIGITVAVSAKHRQSATFPIPDEGTQSLLNTQLAEMRSEFGAKDA